MSRQRQLPQTVFDVDNGTTLTAETPDQSIVVQLAGNPTTGYQWRFATATTTHADGTTTVENAISRRRGAEDRFGHSRRGQSSTEAWEVARFVVRGGYAANGQATGRRDGAPMMGGGGAYTFRVVPAHGSEDPEVGSKVAFTFAYDRAWEDKEADKTYTVTIAY